MIKSYTYIPQNAYPHNMSGNEEGITLSFLLNTSYIRLCL